MGRRRFAEPVPDDSIDTLHGRPVAEELDLHGCAREEARIKLASFIARWAARQHGVVVRVITGRGNRSEQGPVLGHVVEQSLRGALAPMVRTHQPDSRGGAWLVEIR